MKLVICEKPSVGAAVAAALGVTGKKDGYRNVLTPFSFRINPQQPRMFLDKESDAR